MIFGAIMGMLITPLVSRMLRFLSPVVTGSIILVIGVSLMRIGSNWIFGNPFGPTAPRSRIPPMLIGSKAVTDLAAMMTIPAYAPLCAIGISALAVLAIMVIARMARGFVSNIAVLLGCVVAALLGMMHVGKLGDAKGDMAGRKVTRPIPWEGLRTDGHGALIGGIFNSFPDTSFSQNVGLVCVTGIKSRFLCVAGGLILIVMGLTPKMGALVEAVPLPVLGGARLVMFVMVAATGIRILSKVDFTTNRNNLFVVFIAFGFGMIPLIAPNFKQWMPQSIHPLIESGILLATIAAVALDAFFNGAKSTAQKLRAPTTKPTRAP